MKPSTRPVSIEQVRSLLKKSARDMKDAATPGLSSERVFTILYEAGFSCAQAFALANKMEAPREGGFGHHYEILEYLVEGLMLPDGVREQSRIVRTTRNANLYTGAEDVSEQDLRTAYQWATRVQSEAVGWFQKNMPQALPKR
jgi:hypothetical protein